MPQIRAEREYHSYLRTFCGDFIEVGFHPNQPHQGVATPTPTNVLETENGYRIQVALPGFSKKQIRLRVDEDVLLISAEVKIQEEQEHKKYHRQEIFSSSFEKSILLPEDVDDGDIKASFKDGLLNIELPRSNHPTKSTMEISIH